MESYKDADTEALIATAQQDDGAFAELLLRYTPMMNKVISGFFDPRYSYDEVFSEACVAFHKAVKTYDLSRSSSVTFGLYARICVYRRLCDFFGKSAKELLTVDVDVESIGSVGDIEHHLVVRERIRAYLERAHGVLSEYEYSVFLLYIDGYSVSEISSKLNKDVKSVENAKLRIFKKLRDVSDIFSGI